MNVMENARRILEGTEHRGNAWEHELASIVHEVADKGYCERDYVLMNNACFRWFDDFKEGRRSGLRKACVAVGLTFTVSCDGATITFRKISSPD